MEFVWVFWRTQPHTLASCCHSPFQQSIPKMAQTWLSFTSTSLFSKKFCLLSMPLSLPCSHSFLPAETDTEGSQPMSCKQTSTREMRCPSHLLMDTPNLDLECTPIGGARLSAVMWKDARESEEGRHWFLPLYNSLALTQSCPNLWDPVDCIPPAPLSLGFSRQE